MDTQINRPRVFPGPYILATVRGELRFLPARRNENNQWVALTPEEVEAAMREVAEE
jgi:hypothetical protein